MANKKRVLITGAAGTVGSALWQAWQDQNRYTLTLTDHREITAPSARIELGDIADREHVRKLCADQDALVHLAYIPHAPLADVTDIGVSMQLFEAACEAGVKTIVYASSNSAIGMNEHQFSPPRFSTGDQFRPNSWYGAMKCMAEMAGSYLGNMHDMHFVSIRIGTFTGGYEPSDLRQCTTLLTPRDAVQLFGLAVDYEGPVKFIITYGTSGNYSGHQLGFLDISSAVEILGYRPQDNLIKGHQYKFLN